MFNTSPKNKKAAVPNVGPFPIAKAKGDPPAKPYVDIRLPLFSCSDKSRPSVPAWLTTDAKCEKKVKTKNLKITLLGYIAKNKVRKQALNLEIIGLTTLVATLPG